MSVHEELFRPWGTVTPAFWGAPELPTTQRAESQSSIPNELKGPLVEIAATAAAGQLPEAAWMAYELDSEVTTTHGPDHLNTVHIREVRAHLAHLAGDHATAFGWYLHTARLRATIQGAGHPDTAEATKRVYSLWRSVPEADSVRLGSELLAAVTDIHGPEAPVTRRTRKRMQSLSAPQIA
ncbi:hypothetical protein [Streptomyces poriferorum]|uniref:Tetratricopeptide repeat protein n=1 Tax=Streptomyces poriferorum TaxID=2798799 RepID=A0ABY9J2B5_9ACTN|nr:MULTISPECIES: hypothetical protein [unclassified Streptomyces]MDP5317394.1 hypothetical protein [Streptomyces sp. Alt4]WLQ62000.1 hypothetical protein P8A19_41740 [Streptomyces sp. Alt2]